MSRLIVAKSAGFCGGVARAVRIAEETLREGKVCWSLGQIIHNDDVVRYLEEQGLHTAKAAEDIPRGATAIIRSHGEPKSTYDTLRACGVDIVDATCQNVKKIHKIVSDAQARGRQVIVIGDAAHPEVIGICGWCSDAIVKSDNNFLAQWFGECPSRKTLPISVVFQTTLHRNIQRNCDIFLKKECTNA